MLTAWFKTMFGLAEDKVSPGAMYISLVFGNETFETFETSIHSQVFFICMNVNLNIHSQTTATLYKTMLFRQKMK